MENFKLYAVTDYKRASDFSASQIENALKGGVDVIQLRSKQLSDADLFKIGKAIRRITLKRKKLFIVNDRTDLMLALNADGVHLGQDDLPVDAARHLFGKQHRFIGKSTHSIAQAIQAEKEGADYIGFGPIFGTPTKPTYEPIGLKDVSALKKKIKIPFVCIGGINENNLDEVLDAGAERVAVVRGIFSKPNCGSAAAILKEKLKCRTH